MISPATIQQILSRIDIIDIVGSFVKLKKRGVNYLGLCPFHNERTPSFTVSPSKEIYKCFGCGRSGNSIGFLMEHEKLSYVEALKWLGAKYNIAIEETEVSAETKQLYATADSLYILNNFAAQFFSNELFSGEEGVSVGLSYLKGRGFREDTLKKFQVGYNAENGQTFLTAATSAQYGKEVLQKSGLIAFRDDNGIDNYRGRIVFPVHNQSGKIAGFGARIIKSNDRAPKYINTPENEIYVKSKILYGAWLARQAIDKADECLLVEGYTDVLALHQAGIENVVASGGTSLTPDQLRLVKKYTNNLTIVYDGDAAGIKAALRGLDLALEEGLNVRLALIPDNEDPDSYIQKTGVENFKIFIRDNKNDFILFQLELALKEAGQDSYKKSLLVNQVAETISKINKVEDFTRQQDYIQKTASVLSIDEAGLHSLVNKFVRERILKQEGKNVETQNFESSTPTINESDNKDEANDLFKPDEKNEKALVRVLLEFGIKEWEPGQSVANFILSSIEEEELIEDEKLLHIITLYKNWYKAGQEPTEKTFLYYEDQELAKAVFALFEFPYEVSLGWSKHNAEPIPTRESLYQQDVLSTINYLKLKRIKAMILVNQKDIQQHSDSSDLNELIQLHRQLKVMEIELTKHTGTVILK
ncbi:MAG: DNA primase [Ginsengibacter sp.]